MTQTVLILGATGRFGRNAAEAFATAGWQVRRFDRKTGDLMQAAQGADVIVNGWNPPYDQWHKTVPGLTRQVIAAAKASGATVIIPGNVYVFGPDAPQQFGSDTPHRATNTLGRIRVEMEAAYREAGVPTILLRAGDFLDTEASGNWFDKIMVNRLAKGYFVYPGALDRVHAFAYLPDVARAAVMLAERRHDLPRFADVPFAGYSLTGAELGAAVSDAWGAPLKVVQMNWVPLQLLSPFWKMARHLGEMRYLWNKPHHLDAAPLQHLLPEFRPTPLSEAMRAALAPMRQGQGLPAAA